MRFSLISEKLNFSWDQFANAFWRRYPNPKSKHVLSEDTFYREVLPNGNLLSKRLIVKKNSVSLPSWGSSYSPRLAHCVEESIVNPKDKSIVTYTRNINARNCLIIEEKITFSKSGAAQNETSILKEVFMKSPLRFIGGAIQKIVMDSYLAKTSPNSTAGFRFTLTKMFRPHELTEDERLSASQLVRERLHGTSEKVKEKAHMAREKAHEKAHIAREKAHMAREKAHEKAHQAREKAHEKAHQAREKAHISLEKSKEKIDEVKKRTKVFADSNKKE